MGVTRNAFLAVALISQCSCKSQRFIEFSLPTCKVGVPSHYRLIADPAGDRYMNGEGSSISVSPFIKPLPTREVPGGRISTRLIESGRVAVYEGTQLRYSNGMSSTIIQMTDGSTQILFTGEAAQNWRAMVHGCGLRPEGSSSANQP